MAQKEMSQQCNIFQYKKSMYARPYARAIAGKLVDNIFNHETSEFVCRWVSNVTI